MELHNRLHNIIKGAMSIDQYIKEICIINEELTTMGQVIDKFVFTFVFLRGLPSAYTSFMAGLNVRPEGQSVEDTIAQIRAHETMMVFKQKAQNDSSFPLEAN